MQCAMADQLSPCRASSLLDRRKQQNADSKIRKKLLLAELQQCTRTRDLERGKRVHAEAIESGFDSCIYVATALIKVYGKCRSMVSARQAFEDIKKPDVVAWTALISGYVENGEGATALFLFARMKSQGCSPDSFTFVAAIKACTALALEQDGSGSEECLQRLKQLHSEVGCHLDIYVQNTLIDVYCKLGRITDARSVFDDMKHPSVVSWTALMMGYAETGQGTQALNLFATMKSRRCAPNSVTFVAALKACTALPMEDVTAREECLKQGMQIHSEIGCFVDSSVQSSLIDMYAKCGSMTDARRVFDSIKHPDVVSWNALIWGYAENGECDAALDMFAKMKSQGCPPDSFTLVSAIKACTSLAVEQDENGKAECLRLGKQIVADTGFSLDQYVQNAVIDMCAKCGSMLEARKVFDGMKHQNVVSWNTLILGYAENGEGENALNMFARMKSQGCAPNCRTFVAALKASAVLGSLESGREVHRDIADAGTEWNVILVTTLVDFYVKCGRLAVAQDVFDSHPGTRDVSTWTALLAGYSRLGDSEPVFQLFEGMQDAGFKPSAVTFSCVLTCCSHAGLVEKAAEFFEGMSAKHGITPTVDHYNCMVDIHGRSNKLDEAMALLRRIPSGPDTVSWMTVLGACRKWKNVELGTLAFESFVSLNAAEAATAAAAYVLMADIFKSRAGMQEQQTGLRCKLQALRAPRQSIWTSETGEAHRFDS